ncbi:MAG: SpoIID/LytB domain-containing protein [Planctomycetales bacterium]
MTVLRVARVVVLLLLSGLGLAALAFVRTEQFPRVVGKVSTNSANAPPRPATLPSREIRVNLTSDSVSALPLEISGPFEISSPGEPGKILARGKSLAATPLQLSGSVWKLGTEGWTTPELWIKPGKEGVFRLNRGKYRGWLRAVRIAPGKWIAINHVPLEDYLASVVDSEMPLDFGEEARKAQAVVARTYVLYKCRAASPTDQFDVWGNTRSQKYLGAQYQGTDGRWLAGETPAGRKAASETRGIVCRYRGEIFCTYYSAVCGGRTLNGDELFPDAVPIVRSVVCEECAASPLYRWEQRMPRSQFDSRVLGLPEAKGEGLSRIDAIRKVRQSGGRLPRFRCGSGHHRIVLSGLDLRNLFGGQKLYSPTFDLELSEKEILIHGAGHGHGVGLCQWGARGLALRGKTFREILAFYYPGVEISE